jgi:adenosylmethionine-8-amino-7-oxononanoate aminotransferase
MRQAVVGWDLGRVVFRDLERDYPVVERGEGIYLFDTKGRKYIDGSGGSSVVTSIGHGNKRVAAVMAQQAETIAFSPAHCFANKPHIELCHQIAEIAPDGMQHSFLLSGGSEATENAVKFARQYEFERNNRGKFTVIGRWQGFHGNTFGAMTMSGITYRRRIYGPMLGHAVKIPPCFCYRCDWGLTYGQCNLECARALRKAIRQEGPENVLAFIAEPVVGAALGAVPAVPEYFPLIREICDEFDVLFIADEVMTGFGRTGRWFGCDHWGVRPDILIAGKGSTSGYWPFGFAACTGEVFETVEPRGFVHGFTWSHNGVGAAVAHAVLRRLRDDALVEASRLQGERLIKELASTLGDSGVVGDVRGIGLMIGIEPVADRDTKRPFARSEQVTERVVTAARERGLLLYSSTGHVDGTDGDLVMLGPPYTISDEEIGLVVDRARASLAAIG